MYIASYLRSLVATLLSYEVEECELRLWFCISIKLFSQGLGHMRGFEAIGLDVRRALHVGIEGSLVVSVLLIMISRTLWRRSERDGAVRSVKRRWVQSLNTD